MTTEANKREQLPLAQIVRGRLRTLLDGLGSHHVPDLHRRVLNEVERVLIEEVLSRTAGSRSQTAKILGIHRNTLRHRMRALHISALRRS